MHKLRAEFRHTRVLLTLTNQDICYIYGQLSRCFTARGFSVRDPTKGIGLVSSKVTKLPPKIYLMIFSASV